MPLNYLGIPLIQVFLAKLSSNYSLNTLHYIALLFCKFYTSLMWSFTNMLRNVSCFLYSGSRSSLVNVEARSLDAGSVARRCVLTRLVDLTPSHYHRVVSQGAAALLILLPINLSALTEDHKQVYKYGSRGVQVKNYYHYSVMKTIRITGKVYIRYIILYQNYKKFARIRCL